MKKFKFKLLRGSHTEKNENGVEVTYVAGDIFESASDLSQHNDADSPKFEAITE